MLAHALLSGNHPGRATRDGSIRRTLGKLLQARKAAGGGGRARVSQEGRSAGHGLPVQLSYDKEKGKQPPPDHGVPLHDRRAAPPITQERPAALDAAPQLTGRHPELSTSSAGCGGTTDRGFQKKTNHLLKGSAVLELSAPHPWVHTGPHGTGPHGGPISSSGPSRADVGNATLTKLSSSRHCCEATGSATAQGGGGLWSPHRGFPGDSVDLPVGTAADSAVQAPPFLSPRPALPQRPGHWTHTPPPLPTVSPLHTLLDQREPPADPQPPLHGHSPYLSPSQACS